MIGVVTNYTFDKDAKTVTFTGFASIDLNRIIRIIDVTNGVQIFTNRLPGYTGTVATNVLTLTYGTTGTQFANTDKLYIEYLIDNFGESVVASAARGTTYTGSSLYNYGAKGAAFVIDVTAITGTDTPTLVVKLQMKDVVSGNWIDILGAVTGNITAAGQTLLTVYPGLTVVANSKIDNILPREYRIIGTLTAGTTPNFTYSIGAHYIP